MRVNAAIVASLTGAAFAYPVLDSYKEVKEVPAYGVDSQAPAYTPHDVYGDKPAQPSHSAAPKPKAEKPQTQQEKPAPSQPAQSEDECIKKRSALGLDFSACTKGAFQGSLGGSQAPAAPKASSAPMADSTDSSEPTAPIRTGIPSSPTGILKTLNTTQILQITNILNNPDTLNTTKILDVTRILNNPANFLPLDDISKGRKDGDVSGSSFDLPIGKNLDQLVPNGEDDAQNPSSDPLSFATSAAQQLQKSGFLPKRQVRPSFTANGNSDAELSGKASSDEDATSFDLLGSFSTAATGSASVEERDALQLSDDDDESSLTGFLLPTAEVDGERDSAPLPLGLTGSLSGAVMGSAQASSVPVKRTALQLGSDADSASLNGNAAGSAQGQLSEDAESASFTGNAAGSAQGQLSGSTSGLPTDESASFTGNAAANAAAKANSNLSEDSASTSFDLTGNFNGQVAGSANKREAQLSLDEVTALLAPLTGMPAPKAGGAAKRELEVPELPIDSADFFGDFKSDLEGQLTTSTSAAADSDDAEDDEDEMAKRQLSLDSITALLAPITGAPAPAAGAPAKREAQLSLDEVTALLAPLTGMPAPKAGGAAKRQLSLDSITALLAPLTGSPAPAAGGAPAKREAQLSLDEVTALLAPLTGMPAPKAGGAPAKREAQLSLDEVTALLAPLTGSPAPAAGGAPAKREAQLSLDEVTALLAPLTGAPAPAAGGAPAKRQLGLDAVTGLLAPITGAPAPGAPAKRESEYTEPEAKKEEKTIPQPANIHFAPGGADDKLDIQCLKAADGKCKTTGSDEEKLTPPKQDMFDPVAPQYHGSFDSIKKLLPKLPSGADNKEVKPAHEKPDILGSLKNVVPVPV